MKNKKNPEELDSGRYFSLTQEIIANEKKIKSLEMENVPKLAEILKDELFRVEFENWAGFLGQLEIYRSRTEINRLINIKEGLMDRLGFTADELIGVDVTRLEFITKHALDKTQAETMIEKAKSLSSRDWRNEANVVLGKPQMEDCKHESHPELLEAYRICKNCGQKSHLELGAID